MKNEIKKIGKFINLASICLFEKQPNLFKFTSATNQTEWNLAHHLAFELKQFFPEYDCDIDVVKHNEGNRRPDMIFHTRGKFLNDYLVIEVKYNGTDKKIDADVEKIYEHWFNPHLNYQFGAVVNLLSSQKANIEVFPNERYREQRELMIKSGIQ